MKLEIEGLCKTYANGVKALDDVTMTIPQGMFGLLGPNGAGKSTLMRTLATLQEADQGSVRLFCDDTGAPIDVLSEHHEVRKRLGYLPQEFGVYPKTSATRMLDHIAMLKGVTRSKERRELVDAMLNRVNLYSHRRKAIANFSGGMKQRFGIAQALICNPKLLIVDEPTAGLDPGERNRFYNLLAEIGENVIVILSTHIVQDVKELCPKMAIIHMGQLLYSGSTIDAVETLNGKVWSRSLTKQELPQYQENFDVISTKMVAGNPLVHVVSGEHPGAGFDPVDPDLEDVFFSTIQQVA